jgi:hypothetical protein
VQGAVQLPTPSLGGAVGPAGVRVGPAVHIENANFSDNLDVEGFMKQAAWVAKTSSL